MGVTLARYGLLAALLPTQPPAPVPCPPGPEVAWSAAPRCIGETRTLVGKIDHVARSPHGLLFVNFCSDYKACPLTAVVFRDQAPAFADLPRLSGAEVALTGVITTYRDHPQMVLESRDQLVVRAMPPAVPLTVTRPLVRPTKPTFRASLTEGDGPVAPRRVTEPNVPPPEPERLAMSEAANHVGEAVRLRGRVARLVPDGSDLLVTFSRGEREMAFVAVILEPGLEALRPAARTWVGESVEISGDLTLFNGRPAILVTDEAQVVPASSARAQR